RDAGTIDPAPPSFTDLMKGGRWGNGAHWSVNAGALGYAIDNVPTVGSIAQWNAGECNGCTLGHVAYVEGVHAEGSIDVSEYNYANDHAFGTRSNVTNWKRFIHITNSASAPTIGNYAWTSSPSANQPFRGTISGTGFVSQTEVWFCANATSN